MTRAQKTIRLSPKLALPLDWVTLATVVYGARGSGKTSCGRVMAEETTKAGQRFCAVDLKGDWFGLKSSANGKSEGLPVVVFGGEHADVPLEPGAGAFVGETVAKLEQSCILDFELFSKGKQIRFLAEFFEALYHHNREPLLLLLDEAQRYAPQKPGPDEARTLGAVQDLVKLGRKHGIGPVLFTQRGAGLNKEVSELCDLLVAFRTPGPIDQDRVKDWLDANKTRGERDQIMGQLSGLATGTAVFASSHPELKVFGVYPVRMPETFDSSATPKVGQRRVEPKKLAAPDLEGLKAKMAEAIARAKADDPKALRARIAELEKQKAPKPATPAPKVERVEVPVVKKEDVVLMKRLEQQLAKGLKDIGRLANAAEALTKNKPIVLPSTSSAAALITQAASTLKAQRSERSDPTARAVARPKVKAPAPDGGAALGKCARAMLTAIAQHGPLTLTQAALIAGYSTSSSTPGNAVSELRGLGYVDGGNAGGMTATEDGMAELGDYTPLPTGARLAQYWLGQIGKCEAAILQQVLDGHPDAVSLAKAAEAAGYSMSSSTPGNAASKLRTLNLVHGSNAGMTADERLIG